MSSFNRHNIVFLMSRLVVDGEIYSSRRRSARVIGHFSSKSHGNPIISGSTAQAQILLYKIRIVLDCRRLLTTTNLGFFHRHCPMKL